MSQAKHIILACFGQIKCMTMTKARHKIRAKKGSQIVARAPKLYSLSQTTDSFAHNAACVHLQVVVWRKAMEPNPP